MEIIQHMLQDSPAETALTKTSTVSNNNSNNKKIRKRQVGWKNSTTIHFSLNFPVWQNTVYIHAFRLMCGFLFETPHDALAQSLHGLQKWQWNTKKKKKKSIFHNISRGKK